MIHRGAARAGIRVGCYIVICASSPLAVRAQSCLTQTTRTEPVDVRGTVIRHIVVHSGGTGSLPVVGAWTHLRVSSIAGSPMQRASIRHRELSGADPWRVELVVNRQRFGSLGDSVATRRALFGSALIGRIIGSTARAITVPYVCIELDSAEFSMLGPADMISATRARAFAPAEIGISRRAATFHTASWIVPNRGFLDVPLGLEGDVLFAPGRDRGQDALAARYDAWIGRMWMPSRGQLVAVDAWTSGFLGNVREDHISRLSVNASGQAWRGFWSSGVFVEQLLPVDRDRRLLSLGAISTDPTFSAVPKGFGFANRTAATSIERSFHIRPLGGASILD